MEHLGVELEMVAVDRATGLSHPVRHVFEGLADRREKEAAGPVARLTSPGGRLCGVRWAGGVSSVDNGYNNLESSLGPVEGGPGGLARLDALVRREMAAVLDALEAEGATVLNASEHPAVIVDDAYARTVRADKPIYRHWIEDRGWRHAEGLDAKAQNGPTTQIAARDAARGLNMMLALAPVFIALFANSPLEAGRPTGLKENRLTLWPRMFAAPVFPCDGWLHRLPPAPFAGLGAYLHWMFGAGTAMHVVPAAFHDHHPHYKETADLLRVAGDPPVAAFLDAASAPAFAADGREASITPSVLHAEFLQFSNFLDARIRFRLERVPSVRAFLAALRTPGAMERLFEEFEAVCWLEGRAGGAVFPDRETVEDAGEAVAASVVMAPSALQAGLLRNLDAAEGLAAEVGWGRVADLRERAMRDALADPELRRLCARAVDAAESGLAPEDRPYLAAARHALDCGRTGADRLLALWESAPDPLPRIAERRSAPPAAWWRRG